VAALAQCPYIANTGPVSPSFGLFKIIVLGCLDVLKRAVGLAPIYVKAAADPGELAILAAPGAQEGLYGIVANSKFALLSFLNP
jgi:hypothetical protein